MCIIVEFEETFKIRKSLGTLISGESRIFLCTVPQITRMRYNLTVSEDEPSIPHLASPPAQIPRPIRGLKVVMTDSACTNNAVIERIPRSVELQLIS